MIVLKILGWILLSILALLIIILCIKVKITAEYSDENTFVELSWLFLKIPLFPKESKKVEETEDKEEDSEEHTSEDTETTEEEEVQQAEDATAEEQSENAPVKKKDNKGKELLKVIYNAHGIDGLLLIVKRLFSYLGSFVGDLMKSLVIEELYLDVRCTKDDAASTAIYYGEVCAGLFPMLGALLSKYKVRKYDVNVYPDYIARFSSASFAVKLHLYPIYLIAIFLVLIFRLIFKVALRFIVKIFLSIKKGKTEN